MRRDGRIKLGKRKVMREKEREGEKEKEIGRENRLRRGSSE